MKYQSLFCVCQKQLIWIAKVAKWLTDPSNVMKTAALGTLNGLRTTCVDVSRVISPHVIMAYYISKVLCATATSDAKGIKCHELNGVLGHDIFLQVILVHGTT